MLVAQVVIACSGSAKPTATPLPTNIATATPESGPATATPQPTPTATAPPSEGMTRGGVLRFAIKEAPPHQDVHQSVSDVLSTWGPGIVYSRLFTYQRGPSVPAPSRIPECDLCRSWEQTGPLEFKFRIRNNARWPNVPPLNGRGVTAHDVAFSYQRQMTEGWPNADLLSNIEEVTAEADDLLRIRLKASDAEIFEKLADGRSVIVAREAVEVNGDLFNGPTLGSGPWIFEEMSSGGATFEANRYYYGKGPYMDGLSVQFIEQDTTRAAGVRADILDFAATTLDEAQSATERFPELQVLSLRAPGTGVEIALKTSRSPLDSPAVRKAVLLAWDMAGATSSIWGEGSGPAVGLNLPDPAWTVDFQERYSAQFGDPDTANGLLTDAGLTPSDNLTIVAGEFGASRDNDEYIQTAQSLADALNALGLRTDAIHVPTRYFADRIWLAGDYDIFVGAPPPIASLNGQLFGIYHSEGPWNTTGFANGFLDDLIEEQAVEMNRERRGELLRKIQDEIMVESQRFYPREGVEHWIWQPRVNDFVPDTSGASGDFLARVWLAGDR